MWLHASALFHTALVGVCYNPFQQTANGQSVCSVHNVYTMNTCALLGTELCRLYLSEARSMVELC